MGNRRGIRKRVIEGRIFELVRLSVSLTKDLIRNSEVVIIVGVLGWRKRRKETRGENRNNIEAIVTIERRSIGYIVVGISCTIINRNLDSDGDRIIRSSWYIV